MSSAANPPVGLQSAIRARDPSERNACPPIVHDQYDARSLPRSARTNIGPSFFATAVGILLWSVALLRSAWASSGVAAFGLLVSAGVLLGFLSGRVGLDVHGFGLIMFSEAAWLVWIGVALCRGSNYPRE